MESFNLAEDTYIGEPTESTHGDRMPKPWTLASPASRGIGLQIARRLLQTTDLPIVATARNDLEGAKSRILEGIKVDSERLTVLKVDVTGTCILLSFATR